MVHTFAMTERSIGDTGSAAGRNRDGAGRHRPTRYRPLVLAAVLAASIVPHPVSAQAPALEDGALSTSQVDYEARPGVARPEASSGGDGFADGYAWREAPPGQPQWKGLAGDTGYFLGYQVLVVGVLYVAPESVSGWSDESKNSFSFAEWRQNAGDPHRDSDDHFINYVLHPYWGATYYIRGLERGLDRAGSVAFSAFLSTLFEFGLEALFEQPSYQDLWTTPVIGSMLGEFWFRPLRERIRAKPGPLDWRDKTLLALTDPLGVVGAETDRRLGRVPELRLRAFDAWREAHGAPRAGSRLYTPAGDALRPVDAAVGLQLRFRW
jgi:hypothetical protein